MGSFAGHIDEAIFFLVLGVWWMLNIFSRQIWNKSYKAQLSYGIPCCCMCGKTIPIEAILKTLFPFAGFVAEIWASREGYFIDENGNFQHLVQQQHMTIYAMFFLHGVIDILMSVGVPLPVGLDYLTMGASLLWYGLAFSFHAHMEGKEPVESIVHVLPIYILYAAALAVFVEYWKPNCLMATFSRIYCLVVLGSWFTHVSYILYLPGPFPGNLPNPKWDRSDPRNVHALVAIFGFHCLLHVVTIPVFYMAVYGITWLLRRPLATRVTIKAEEAAPLAAYKHLESDA